MATKLKVKSTTSDCVFNFTLYTVSALFLAVIIYPLYFIIIASISDPAAVNTGKVWLVPVSFTLEGYQELLKQANVWLGYRNTILYTAIGTLIALAINVSAGFALSWKNLPGRKVINLFFIFIMFFSGGLIATFLTVQNFGLYNTFWVMVLPFSVSVYNVIVARTFFQNTIPADLWESAQLDGCGYLRYFVVIALPLSKAILAVLALWTAVGHWNSYFNALIYIRDESLYPLQLVLRNILVNNQMMSAMGTGEAAQIALRAANLMRYALIIVSTAPILCIYPFVQKYFNQGTMVGAVKG
jgi:putative aldouronate transport system permease protein